MEDCLNLLKMGESNRAYAETKMNHQSSRSHTLYRLYVESIPKPTNMNFIEESLMEISSGRDNNVVT